MRKLIFAVIFLALIMTVSHSCRMAPKDNPGDTVDAKYFTPYEKPVVEQDSAALDSTAAVQDSTDLYYIGEGSTKDRLQLVSYPSHRDTVVYTKGKHIKVNGNADFGHVVRVKLWISENNDTLVRQVDEFLEGR